MEKVFILFRTFFSIKKIAYITAVTVLASGLIFYTAQIYAQGTSSNYRIDESYIGPGGALESSSNSYSIDPGQQTLGNAGGAGESSSASYTSENGATSTSDPRLVCTVNSSSLNLGALSTSVTVSGSATFSVLNYTAYGYNVTILGSPPTNSSHALSALSSNSASTVGTEQFGINLKDNTTPDVGAEAVQVPSGSFSYGQAATNYNVVDSFRYVSGETIAQAPKSSGQTDYTISYIINTSTSTPGGSYLGNQTLLCTGTY